MTDQVRKNWLSAGIHTTIDTMSGPTSDEIDDTHQVNKENATPTSPYSTSGTKPSPPEVRVKVGGMSFVLDQETLTKLNSEYLNRRVMFKDPDVSPKASPPIQEQQLGSPWKQTTHDDAVVVEEADAECFSSIVHMARFGTLPTSIFNSDKREMLLQQAETVWGIRSQVEAALDKARSDFRQSCNYADAINRCLMTPVVAYASAPEEIKTRCPTPPVPPMTAYASAKSNFYAAVPPGELVLNLGGPHHNFRRDDGSRRVFCSSCGHRDIDWRYHVGDYYASCQKCQKEIRYKPDLGWCHKCRMCESCQTSECPGVPIKQLEDHVVPFMIATLKSQESSLSFF